MTIHWNLVLDLSCCSAARRLLVARLYGKPSISPQILIALNQHTQVGEGGEETLLFDVIQVRCCACRTLPLHALLQRECFASLVRWRSIYCVSAYKSRTLCCTLPVKTGSLQNKPKIATYQQGIDRVFQSSFFASFSQSLTGSCACC